MRTVQEVSRISGVSVRTLHHYDAIGLLPPTRVSAAGYRLYDDAALARLQSILLLRQLEFPLAEIKAMLDAPGYDAAAALTQQIALLQARRRQLDRLIDLARALQRKEARTMDFTPFDTAELERYKAEAREKWGGTAAWAESRQKAAGRNEEEAAAGLMAVLAGFGPLRGTDPAAAAARQQAAALQAYITRHYYTCTDAILAGLGQMYTADERFAANIDAAGGEGTADFAARAIAAYCAGK